MVGETGLDPSGSDVVETAVDVVVVGIVVVEVTVVGTVITRPSMSAVA